MQVMQEHLPARPAGRPADVQNCSWQICEPLFGSNSLAREFLKSEYGGLDKIS